MGIDKMEIKPGIYSKNILIKEWNEKWDEIYGEGVCYASALSKEANSTENNDLKIVLPKRANCKLKQLAIANCEKVKEVYVQGTVNEFANQAFSNCKELERIMFVNNDSEISLKVSDYTFYDCEKLSDIFVFCEEPSKLLRNAYFKRGRDSSEEELHIHELGLESMLESGLSLREICSVFKLLDW